MVKRLGQVLNLDGLKGNQMDLVKRLGQKWYGVKVS